jgi:hypothetical protein
MQIKRVFPEVVSVITVEMKKEHPRRVGCRLVTYNGPRTGNPLTPRTASIVVRETSQEVAPF